MEDLISRAALLAAYDAAHKGPPGGARKLIEEAPTIEAERIIRCKDCRYCYKLENTDPLEPWDGSGNGSFYCKVNEMDFYAPHYSAKTYFCGDAEEREDKA